MTVMHTLRWAGEALHQHLSLTLIFLIVILATRYFITQRRYKLPPGPWGFPVVGYLPFFDNDIFKTLLELKGRFGSIYRVSFGTQSVVVLADPDVIRDAFRKEEFHHRPTGTLFDIFDGYGLLNSTGVIWKDQRRFLHEKLRGLGMKTTGPGREKLEARIMSEVKCLLHCLASGNGKAIDVEEVLCNALTNVICILLMSVRFQPNNPHFTRFMELYDEGFKLFLKCNIACYIPACRYIPSVSHNIKKLIQNRGESCDMIKGIINHRRETFDPEVTADILDSYLLEERRAKEEGRVLYDGLDFDRQLTQVMTDMFSAGEETVKTVLMWSFVYLLRHPEVMKRVQEELDAVVGRLRMPSLDDQQHLPYTEATICEVLRRSSVVPLGTFHATNRTTELGGYTIPENTTVIPLLYACHMDPKQWDNPEAFDPMRFIDAEGGVKKPSQFMPFGIGRRICLGQVLARSELFLFFTSILHVFDVALPEGEPMPSMDGDMATTYSPKPFKVSFIQRDSPENVTSRPYVFRGAGL